MNTVIKTKRSVINNKDCGSSSLKINRTNEIREWLIDRQPLKVGTDQEGAKL